MSWSKGWKLGSKRKALWLRNSRGGVQAPVGSNPFAPAPVGQAAAAVPDESATGPMLNGKGPELQKAAKERGCGSLLYVVKQSPHVSC